MGDCGVGNFGLLNGVAIEACPALFPCKIGCASATTWRGSRHELAKSPLGQRKKKVALALAWRSSGRSVVAAVGG